MPTWTQHQNGGFFAGLAREKSSNCVSSIRISTWRYTTSLMKAPGSNIRKPIWTVNQGQVRSHVDYLATEEPLEIRLPDFSQTLAITMRTPGHDFDLVAGFLLTEGLIQSRTDIQTLTHCVDPGVDSAQRHNIVNVSLNRSLHPDFKSLERHFFTTSACGVCGRASIEALQLRGQEAIASSMRVSSDLICQLPEQLRKAQSIFTKTGGLHAAALFSAEGELLRVREDVGRHNALDKLIGAALLAKELPLEDGIVMVSGRSSFEMMQKCLMARVPVVCAVSAPSSLAVAIAHEFNMTLIGFLRGQTFNVYAGIERIA